MKADAVVLGAGIIGTAVARQLAHAGVSVVLVDAAEIGGGTSSRCDGNVLVQAKHDALGIKMTQYSIGRYRKWVDELGPGIRFHQNGSLVFFTDRAGLAVAHDRCEWLSANGVAARFVDDAQIQELEPELNDRALGGIDCQEDASVYPPGVVAALVRDAQRHGCRILAHTRAKRILASSSGEVRGVDTDDGVISTPIVINALGVWSPELDGDSGLRIPVTPRQGILAVTEDAPGLVNRAVTEGTYMTTRASPGDGDVPGIAFVAEPTFRGNVLIGSTRRFCGFDVTVDLALLNAVLKRAISFLPRLAETSIVRAFAGLRPWTPDNRPIIGASPTLSGYLLATGHEGEGIGLAPITADIIAAIVTGDPMSPLFEQVLDAVNPGRFEPETAHETHETA